MLRIHMKKLRELIRLKFDAKLTHRQIAAALNISPSTVSHYASAAAKMNLTWPLPDTLDDDALTETLEPHAKQLRQGVPFSNAPDWSAIHAELANKHVTQMLLWEEYQQQATGKVYSYSQFTRCYKKWCKQKKVTMRISHTPGEKAFIDYAGATISIYCRQTQEVQFKAQLFVMVLGASDYTFIHASKSQQLPDWINAHVKAFDFFGGVPSILVPDNLKSGITDSCKFEPLANPTYADLAAHYGTAIIPARPRMPRDKAKAESTVLIAERWIVARLRKQKFYSLHALNNAIRELCHTMNHKPFQKRQGSRSSQFIEHEKSTLQALPKQGYQFATFKELTVPSDYHLRLDAHYYSVPYQLNGEKVFCRLTAEIIEIFYKNNRVASHLRADIKDEKTTNKAHMPKAHLKYQSWIPQDFLDWANTIGPGVMNMANEMMKIKSHPEQCYKIHMGLKKLNKQFKSERLNHACRRAMLLNCLTFKSIQSILDRGLDQVPYLTEVTVQSTPAHQNLRGADYYRLLND